MRPLTDRQEQIYQFLREEIEEKGRSPSLKEIGDHFEMAPPSVADHLAAIEAKGHIQRVQGERRNIRIVDREGRHKGQMLPLLGRIAAGAPLLAPEHIEDWLPVAADVFRPAASFLMYVQGDSMIDIGIESGDLVAIHAQPAADHGQVIAALLKNEMTGELETTLKRLRVEPDRILLVAENRAAGYSPIVVPRRKEEDGPPIAIAGVYCGHIRRRSI